MKRYDIRHTVIDTRSPSVIREAIKVAENYNASALTVKHYMREIFYLQKINDEIISFYNSLEKKWMTLTNFKINETHVI